MERIGFGRTAEVYRDGDGGAVKLFYGWVPAAQAENEASVSRLAAALYGRAPRFLGTCEIGGRLGLRFECVDGELLVNAMTRRPLRLAALVRLMGRMHREMHAIDAVGHRTMADALCGRIRRFEGAPDAVKRRLADSLQQDGGRALCHGDYHPENIMLNGSGSAFVIDWNNSYAGNPLSDVARTHYLLRHGVSPAEQPLHVRIAVGLLRPVLARTYLRAYLGGDRIPRREWNRWQLIVRICRWEDGIAEERPRLARSIGRMLAKQFGNGRKERGS